MNTFTLLVLVAIIAFIQTVHGDCPDSTADSYESQYPSMMVPAAGYESFPSDSDACDSVGAKISFAVSGYENTPITSIYTLDDENFALFKAGQPYTHFNGGSSDGEVSDCFTSEKDVGGTSKGIHVVLLCDGHDIGGVTFGCGAFAFYNLTCPQNSGGANAIPVQSKIALGVVVGMALIAFL